MRTALAFLLLLCSAVDPAAAQVNANAPAARASAQRAAILDALRPAIERDLRPRVEFVVHCIQVERGVAIVDAQPQRPGGRAIDPRSMRDWQNRDGLTVTAVMRFRGGRWTLDDYVIGATDVWYQPLVTPSLMRRPCA